MKTHAGRLVGTSWSLALAVCLALFALPASSNPPEVQWRGLITKQIRELGQRNWIVVADAAFPSLSERGVETITTDAEALPALRATLEILAQSGHVQPTLYTPSELRYVYESDAPGTGAYRSAVEQLFRSFKSGTSPLDGLIARIQETAKTYRVLVIKTRMTLPYGAAFLQLEPAAWSAEAEKRVRDAMARP